MKRQVEIVDELVQDAVNNGATLVAGGKRNEKLDGLFYEPTLLTNVVQGMRIVNEVCYFYYCGVCVCVCACVCVCVLMCVCVCVCVCVCLCVCVYMFKETYIIPFKTNNNNLGSIWSCDVGY